jgi:hypothetical protein
MMNCSKRCFSAGLFLSLLVCSTTARGDVIKWTLQDVTFSGFFGGGTVTGFFETGTGHLTTSITVNEQTNPTLYTYEFDTLSGTQPSKQPPTPCFLGCVGTVPNTPFPATLDLFPVIAGPPPGPYLITASFEDDLEVYSGGGKIIGTPVAPVPEPSTWSLAFMGMAFLSARWKLRRA